jgi:hypothetical protein
MSLTSALSKQHSLARLGRHAGVVGALLITVLLTGCLTQKRYIDPTLPKIDVASLKQPAVTQPVQLFFEFQTNGANNIKATEYVRPMVLDTLKKSKLFSNVVVAPATAPRKLYVTINNLGNMEDAKARGFTTGLTLGMSGTMVTDGYQLTASDVMAGKDEVKHSYKQAMYTTIGNADGPSGLKEVPKEDSVRLVMESLTLNLLNDMSKSGELQ